MQKNPLSHVSEFVRLQVLNKGIIPFVEGRWDYDAAANWIDVCVADVNGYSVIEYYTGYNGANLGN